MTRADLIHTVKLDRYSGPLIVPVFNDLCGLSVAVAPNGLNRWNLVRYLFLALPDGAVAVFDRST